jgi:hypothetical protein
VVLCPGLYKALIRSNDLSFLAVAKAMYNFSKEVYNWYFLDGPG